MGVGIGLSDIFQSYPGPGYLLRDDFTDTVAAGSVNGMAATPGPGTRIVKDSDTKISVDNDAARFGDNTAWNREGLYYGPFTRETGRALYMLFLDGDVQIGTLHDEHVCVGWFADPTPAFA